MWVGSLLGSGSSFSPAGLPLASSLWSLSPSVVEPSPESSESPSPEASPTPSESTAGSLAETEPGATCGLTVEAPCFVSLDPTSLSGIGVALIALTFLGSVRLVLALRR